MQIAVASCHPVLRSVRAFWEQFCNHNYWYKLYGFLSRHKSEQHTKRMSNPLCIVMYTPVPHVHGTARVSTPPVVIATSLCQALLMGSARYGTRETLIIQKGLSAWSRPHVLYHMQFWQEDLSVWSRPPRALPAKRAWNQEARVMVDRHII